MKTDNEQKQYLTREQIEQATIEELEANVKNMQEELNQLKDIETEKGKERFRELIHLRFLCNSRINLIEFSDMVWKNKDKRKRKENEEEQ
tara:strand:- start:7 stop:276 length:270 start_codon:yes stop_codon:yes gene_type:complete